MSLGKRKYKYAALCIGINDYDNNRKLSNAANDAKVQHKNMRNIKPECF